MNNSQLTLEQLRGNRQSRIIHSAVPKTEDNQGHALVLRPRKT